MSEVRSKIYASLQSEHDVMRAIRELLESEQQMLITADIDSVNGLNTQKTEHVTQSSELSRNRYKLLQLAGFEGTEGGMSRFLRMLEMSDEIRKPWDMLLEETKAAKELNRVNGLLIAQHLSRNSSALAALGSTGQHTGTYGPDGQATRNRTRGITA